MVHAAPVLSQSRVTVPFTSLKVFLYIEGQPTGQSHTTESQWKEGWPAVKWQPADKQTKKNFFEETSRLYSKLPHTHRV